jgi:hypothetical protein
MKIKYKKENRNKIIAVAILGIIGISVGAFVLSPLAPLYYDRFGPYTESRYILPPTPPALPSPAPPPPPAVPILNDIIPTVSEDGLITLSWSAVSGATTYGIYRSDNGGSYQRIKIVELLTYSEKKGDGNYNYKITAFNAFGQSGYSNAKSVNVDIYVFIVPIEVTPEVPPYVPPSAQVVPEPPPLPGEVIEELPIEVIIEEPAYVPPEDPVPEPPLLPGELIIIIDEDEVIVIIEEPEEPEEPEVIFEEPGEPGIIAEEQEILGLSDDAIFIISIVAVMSVVGAIAVIFVLRRRK